jgi:acetyl esterase/lipase
MRPSTAILAGGCLVLAACALPEESADPLDQNQTGSGDEQSEQDSLDPDQQDAFDVRSDVASMPDAALPPTDRLADDLGVLPSDVGLFPDAGVDAPPPPAPAWRCTQVIGYSQVQEWYVTDGVFESQVDDGEWQLLWNGGGGVHEWQDPSYVGWTNRVTSPCRRDSEAPDRVLLSVSGPYGDDVQAWTTAIRETIKTVRDQLPSVRQIVLQAVVGGPDHEICRFEGRRVRASWQHPYIDEAIAGSASVAADVVAGFSPEVRSCSDYRDATGHLTPAGAAAAGLAIGAYYASPLNGPVYSAQSVELRDQVFARVGGRALHLDLHVPRGNGPFPLIINIHGGGWRQGSYSISRSHPAMQQLDRGYAVASVEYRLSHEAIFPAQIHDVKAAVRWLRANAARYNLDANLFVAFGSSAGGHLAALLGTSAGVAALEDLDMGNASVGSEVQGVIDWFGPTDFLQMGGRHDLPTSPESELIGCALQTCPPELVHAANPIAYVDGSDPRFLIQHGLLDTAVPPSQSKLLAAALEEAGVGVQLRLVAGVGHGLTDFAKAPGTLDANEEFLDTYFPNRFWIATR